MRHIGSVRFPRSVAVLLAAGVLAGCAATPHFRDDYLPPVAEIIAPDRPDADDRAYIVSDEIDVSIAVRGQIATVEFYKSETERFTMTDGACYLSMLHVMPGQGNWIKVDVNEKGWFLRARSVDGAVAGSARCVYLP